MATPTTTMPAPFRDWGERLRRGGCEADRALDEMFEWVRGQVARLVRWRLRRNPRIRRWHETDDVLQEVIGRLCRAHLNGWSPNTTQDLILMTTVMVNRVLLDMARSLYGPEGLGANHASNGGLGGSGGSTTGATPHADPVALTDDPVKLAQWAEFHKWVETLDREDQKLVGLILYQGWTQVQAAAELGIAAKTVFRRWKRLSETIVTLLPDP